MNRMDRGGRVILQASADEVRRGQAERSVAARGEAGKHYRGY